MIESPTNQIQHAKHKKQFFDLKATFQPSQTSPEQSNLTLFLKVYALTGYDYYRSAFTELTIPQQVLATFSSLDIIFQCFKEQNGFQVNLKTGQIIIKGIFQIKGRKIEKKSLIPLEKYKVSQYQTMLQQIQQLQQQVQGLKCNKNFNEEKLRKQYQQRFDEQKRKFDQIIRQKEAEQQKNKQRQKELQTHLQSLQNQMNNLVNKIDEITRENISQFEQLRLKSQSCQTELLKTKQQLQQLLLQKRGQEGRKMVKIHENSPLENGNKKIQKQNLKVSFNSRLWPNGQKQEKPLPLNSIKPRMEPKNNAPVLKFIDQKSINLSKFKIKNQNSITYMGENGSETILLMKDNIPRDTYNFEFQIAKTQQRSILIGVADRSQAQKAKFSDKRSVSYWGKTGYIWGGDKMQGEGFQEGDTVSVNVQLDKQLIEWRVNGKLAASCQPQFFKDHTKEFAPFVQMQNQGDSVIWHDKTDSRDK